MIELIGGYGIAKALVLEAIAAGKHVVTANKALLAVHGTEIFAAASAKGVMVAFEAAVAGGIPIIKALREGLTANSIQWIAGIINGTTNFILSEMRDKGLDFDVVLKEAQRLGYAEADPTFDIEGVDAAHKATLMSAIAFGIPVQFDKAYVEGITKLGAADIRYAEQLGYRIKLLGITKRTARGMELRVHPCLVPAKRLIANVEGAMNAVMVQGDAVGTTLYYGKGAGSEPTASAVIADLVDITRLHTVDPLNRVPHLAFQPHTLDQAMSDLPVLPMSEVVTSYYLRLRVADEAGVLAQGHGHRGQCRHQHRRGAAARGRRSGRRGRHVHRPDHPDARHAGRHDERRPGRAAGAAHGAGADHAHPQGRIELMLYLSTRGDPSRKHFCEILLEGLAPDGGLYLPEHYPQVDDATLSKWRAIYQDQGYAALAFEVLSLYIDDIPRRRPEGALRQDLHRSGVRHQGHRAAEASWKTASTSKPCPTAPRWPSRTWRCSCWATCSSTNWRAAAKQLNILGATSGDTGSAAEYAMRGKKGVRVFMTSPHGRMSPFQQAQMFSLMDDNIHNIAIEGVFDDCQDIVKAVSNDLDFKRKYQIGTVNSINWARLLAQVVYYFAGYFQATRNELGEGQLHRALGQLRQRLRRPCGAHDGPADRASWWRRPTRTMCSTSSSAPVSTACAAVPTRTRPPARRWTSPRPAISNASCSTCWAATVHG